MSQEFKLVPASMLLDKSTIGAINFHCGDGSNLEIEECSEGLLWVGTVTDDDGKEVYGLHIMTAEYPEEGSTTLVEFPAPAPSDNVEHAREMVPIVSEMEVIAYLRATPDGKPEWEEDCVCQDPIYPNFDGDESFSMPMVRQADHLAHVTRLQAEIAALQQRLTVADQKVDDLEAKLAKMIPEGYCVMPRRLTAENGAKALLLGEFKVTFTRECSECCELEEPTEGCEVCDGEGEFASHQLIS